MQTTTALWKTLLAGEPLTEWRVTVGGAVYEKASLIDLRINAGLFGRSYLTVGSCVSAQLRLKLLNAGTIPRMAEVKVYVRLTDGTQASEWLPYGVYYIDTREAVPESGTLTLHCYDAMLKAEQTYLTEGDTGAWPRTMAAVVSSICTRMGVELDSRTALNSAYTVEYPNDYTMREILGYIAAAHGGCWIMTPAGKLRLVTLGGLPEEAYSLITETGEVITFGGVSIHV